MAVVLNTVFYMTTLHCNDLIVSETVQLLRNACMFHFVCSIQCTGPAEPVRPWPDQLFGKIIKFLFLLGIFQGLRTSEAFY